MLHIQIFEIHTLLVWKRVKYALEKGRMLVSMHPVLI
jgi:hypothetical protein